MGAKSISDRLERRRYIMGPLPDLRAVGRELDRLVEPQPRRRGARIYGFTLREGGYHIYWRPARGKDLR